jgi:ATP-dependent exoDNAse (exonuclease V) alpha subunit
MYTKDQTEALKQLKLFFRSSRRCFILRGYAGTGKTFLIGKIAQDLSNEGIQVLLMAPTGRAAKILSQKTKREAHTIHKTIYNFKEVTDLINVNSNFILNFGLKNDILPNTNIVAFIDEASMVSDHNMRGEFTRFGSGRILKDLLDYLRITNPGQISKVVFVGDPAQLPPVGSDDSPALNPEYIIEKFNINSSFYEMTEVVRQEEDNPILTVAQMIREKISSKTFNISINASPPSIYPIKLHEIAERYLQENKNTLLPKMVCIAHKNSTCSNINKSIRAKKYGGPSDIIKETDVLLVIRNNIRTGLMNGDIVTVLSVDEKTEIVKIPVGNKEIKLVFRGIKILVETDELKNEVLPCKILENTLNNNTAGITSDEFIALYKYFKIRNPELQPNTPEFSETILKDPYYNALQVKYGYAITCHKAQGGEWDDAIICFRNRMNNTNYLRWTYTAVTRAKKRFYGKDLPSCYS